MGFIFKRFIQKLTFILTILVFPVYVIGLCLKITEPDTKNLPIEDYLIAGLLLIAMLISDVYLIKHFLRTRKK